MSQIDAFFGLTYDWDPVTENFSAGMDTNLKSIGVAIQAAVINKTVTDPSTLTPSNGDAWIVDSPAVGVWLGHEDDIAAYTEGQWLFLTPKEGWQAWITAETTMATFRGGSWVNNAAAGGTINSGQNLGAGTGVYAQVTSDKLDFKSLVAGSGIGLSATATEITITSTATGAVLVVNNQTGTSYTLVGTDAGKAVEMDNAAANTLTIPPNASVAFSVGTTILVRQQGAGQTTLVAGAGVTIRNPHLTLKFTTQYSSVSLHKRGTDEWCVEGNLTES